MIRSGLFKLGPIGFGCRATMMASEGNQSEPSHGGVAQMERQEENDLGWSKTFVNSNITANFHVAAVGDDRYPLFGQHALMSAPTEIGCWASLPLLGCRYCQHS